MSKISSPYKNNIWSRDERYDFNRSSLSANDYETIRRLSTVDVAKKQIPPVPTLGLLAIDKAIKRLLLVNPATLEDVQEFLETTIHIHGAGIPTLICMLAVESKGLYPPMDRKFALGMCAKEVISASELTILCGKTPSRFTKIYFCKVIPAWRKSLKTRSPEQADNYWGRLGGDAA